MHSDATAIVKTCCKCGETKPIDEFAMKRPEVGARQSHCRTCQKAVSRAHYLANRAKIIARSAENKDIRGKELTQIAKDHLKGKQCACGAKRGLVFKVKPDYAGPRVSAVIHAGMGQETLMAAIAGSTVMCKACAMLVGAEPLLQYVAATKAGQRPEPKNIPRSVYKQRHTLSANDLRKGRFERAAEGQELRATA